MEKKSFIVSLSFTLVACLVIGSTFIPYRIVDNNFQLFPVACAVSIALFAACVWFVRKSGKVFPFQIPDVLLLFSVGYYLLRYDYGERLADWKIYYAVLLLLFWFATRIVLTNYRISRNVLLYGFAFMGCIQAVWGLLQLYGILPSYHPLFVITGSFYNPGPYTGYIALFFPLALYQSSVARERSEMYVWASMAILLFCMIPAGMSRSAWFAILVSCIFVIAVRFVRRSHLKAVYDAHRTRFLVAILLSGLAAIAMVAFLFFMRPESAYGRLFIWKNTLSAIARNPLLGYGPGSFPYVYGQEQSSYFARDFYAAWEEYVADAPEYAFNEYLQLLMEGGLVLFVLAIAFAFVTFYRGIKNKQYGVCAALLSFYVFALASYPMQVLPFGITVIFFSAWCVSSGKERTGKATPRYAIPLAGTAVMAVSVLMTFHLQETVTAQSEIRAANRWNNTGNVTQALYLYDKNYNYVKQNPRLSLYYARMLERNNQLEKAIEVLEDAEKVSCDVAILNTKATCYFRMGKYTEAEKTYYEAIHRTPVRIYPYYMLAKLYATPAYYDRLKLRKMVYKVLEKEPKVDSEAVRRMKEEARLLLFK